MKTKQYKPVAPADSLREVWNWKEKTSTETAEKSYAEIKEYYSKTLEQALQSIDCQLFEESEGIYSIQVIRKE